MARIKIAETIYEAKLTHAGGTLGLSFEKAKIEEIAALLSEANAPEIREMTQDGATKAIYKNHALTRVYAETIGGVYRVSAVMQTEVIEQKDAEALREQLAAAGASLEEACERIAQAEEQIKTLKSENEMLTGCVLEMSETVYA